MSENNAIETAVVDMSNAEVGRVELPVLFGSRVNDSLLFEQVLAQRASRRQGDAATKTKGMISGGGSKPWRQKGTGRARAGSSRSPVWRGGGTIFGPQPRSYEYRLPRKARRAALISALAQKQRDGQLKVVAGLRFDAPKTKLMRATLETLGVGASVLVVIAAGDRNVELSARNLPRVLVQAVEGLNVYDILRHKHLVISQEALAVIEERLSR